MKKTLAISILATGSLIFTASLTATETAQHNHAAQKTITASGTVRSVDTQGGKLVIHHQPISELNWPAMTMPFRVADSALLQGVNPGDKVRFTLTGNGAVITAIKRIP
ncbi:MAG: copper-binding protein [Burkholderiaceae bacterium]|jgi:Cu(I)/Ag(I) efflux system protein CusF|nr:copper-binding protein [Burkholderiaceae bacterium]